MNKVVLKQCKSGRKTKEIMVSEKEVSNLEPEPINNPFHSQKKQLITKIDKIKVRKPFHVL